jgi:hypothetical protein
MVEVRPLTIRVDYLPRRIDLLSLRNGNYAELLNLVTWEGVELRLKGVRSAGVHGWSGLGAVLMNDWVEDISQNQVRISETMGPSVWRVLLAVCVSIFCFPSLRACFCEWVLCCSSQRLG